MGLVIALVLASASRSIASDLLPTGRRCRLLSALLVPDQITRRIKLRHLDVFVAVVQWGSMARAAEHLAISQPVVSKMIAELERTVGVRLRDRGGELDECRRRIPRSMHLLRVRRQHHDVSAPPILAAGDRLRVYPDRVADRRRTVGSQERTARVARPAQAHDAQGAHAVCGRSLPL
jgi:hypothetical protein